MLIRIYYYCCNITFTIYVLTMTNFIQSAVMWYIGLLSRLFVHTHKPSIQSQQHFPPKAQPVCCILLLPLSSYVRSISYIFERYRPACMALSTTHFIIIRRQLIIHTCFMSLDLKKCMWMLSSVCLTLQALCICHTYHTLSNLLLNTFTSSHVSSFLILIFIAVFFYMKIVCLLTYCMSL